MNEIFKGMDNAAEQINENFNLLDNKSMIRELWSGSLETEGTTINLDDSLSNYELIMVIGTSNDNNHYATSNILPVGTSGKDSINVGNPLASLIVGNESRLIFRFPTETTLLSVAGFSKTNRLTAVYGIFPKNTVK